MSLPHAKSGEIIDVRPLGTRLEAAPSMALMKTPHLELMRLVLPSGKSMPQHTVAGELTIQVIEGVLDLDIAGTVSTMRAGELVHLAGNTPHALQAREHCSMLVTVLLPSA